MLPYSILQTMIGLALAFWASIGSFVAPEVKPIDIPDDGHVAGALWPLDNGLCTIRIRPQFYTLSANMQQLAIMHEVGHCIGLDHIDAPGIMNAHLSETTTASAADWAEFDRVHPRAYRIFVPAIAQ